MQCPLCYREVDQLSDHHLVPRCRGGHDTKTVAVCRDCHDGVHAFFTNKELEANYNSIDSLLNDEKFSKHIKWLSKQKVDRKHTSKRVKNKRYRGRDG